MRTNGTFQAFCLIKEPTKAYRRREMTERVQKVEMIQILAGDVTQGEPRHCNRHMLHQTSIFQVRAFRGRGHLCTRRAGDAHPG